LRIEIYDKVNALGIGAQGLGGLTTVLDIKILDYPTHAASLPVAVIPNCAAMRHAHFVLDGGGPVSLEPPAIKRHKAVYVIAVGGAAYLVSKAIRASRVVAFPELGMEAIYEFEVEDMPVTVAVTSAPSNRGNGSAKFRSSFPSQGATKTYSTSGRDPTEVATVGLQKLLNDENNHQRAGSHRIQASR
jgi:hypothetical protein